MPDALKKQSRPEVFPAEERDDDFGSPEDIAALMVEAFTMPLASDFIAADDEDGKTSRTPQKRHS